MMIEPLYIKKDPNRFENLIDEIEDSEWERIVNCVDLFHLSVFINSLNHDDWVPDCYWKQNSEKFYGGELQWGIFAYLITEKVLIIEDKYYGYNNNKSHREKYVTRRSFDNRLHSKLYEPIKERLLQDEFIELCGNFYYKLSTAYNKRINRRRNLNRLT